MKLRIHLKNEIDAPFVELHTTSSIHISSDDDGVWCSFTTEETKEKVVVEIQREEK